MQMVLSAVAQNWKLRPAAERKLQDSVGPNRRHMRFRQNQRQLIMYLSASQVIGVHETMENDRGLTK